MVSIGRGHLPHSQHNNRSFAQRFRKSNNGKTSNDDEAVKSHLVQFFADKDQKFYERGIMKLPER